MYMLLLPQFTKVTWKSTMLTTSVHPKYKFTLWLALKRRSATADKLRRLRIQVPPHCIFCGQAEETLAHLYFDCSHTRELWTRLLLWICYNSNIVDWNTEMQWISKIARKKSSHCSITCCIFGMLVALIWREKNLLRFQHTQFLPDKLCREIAQQIHICDRNNFKWQRTLAHINSYP